MAVKFALKTAVVAFGGRSRLVRRGESWDADDPLVKNYPHLFSDESPDVRRTAPVVPPVETATAAPGELRTVRRRRDG